MKQPKALYLLNFVSMWECFSYYGMRILLVLFMVEEMQYSDSQAFGTYALYITLVELGGLVGGIVADRYLGLKNSITLGAWVIVCGHLTLAIPNITWTFFLGLGLIVSGTGLFRSNVAALLGEFYDENDPCRDAGYTLYYTGINIGGFLATALCGVVAEIFGWHAGFGLAALGMLLGNFSLLMGQKLLAGKGESKKHIFTYKKGHTPFLVLTFVVMASALSIYYQEWVTPVIPFIIFGGFYYIYQQMKESTIEQINKLKKLFLYVFFLIIYFICEEQLGSSLVVFASNHVDRKTAYGYLPTATLITFNPLTILVTGPLLSKLMQKIPLDGMKKIMISFFLLGVAFCTLWLGCLTADSSQEIHLSLALLSIILIALGEIFIGPTVYAYASEVSNQKLQGLIMGIVTLGFALSNLLSGFLSQWMAVAEESSSFDTFLNSFRIIGLALLGFTLIVLLLNNRNKVFIT